MESRQETKGCDHNKRKTFINNDEFVKKKYKNSNNFLH